MAPGAEKKKGGATAATKVISKSQNKYLRNIYKNEELLEDEEEEEVKKPEALKHSNAFQASFNRGKPMGKTQKGMGAGSRKKVVGDQEEESESEDQDEYNHGKNMKRLDDEKIAP